MASSILSHLKPLSFLTKRICVSVSSHNYVTRTPNKMSRGYLDNTSDVSKMLGITSSFLKVDSTTSNNTETTEMGHFWNEDVICDNNAGTGREYADLVVNEGLIKQSNIS
jgi:hypothetical protein